MLEYYPNVKLTLGPSIDNGFYYDVDFEDEKFSDIDLPKIEQKMIELLPSWDKFSHKTISYEDVVFILFLEKHKEYKKLIDENNITSKTIFKDVVFILFLEKHKEYKKLIDENNITSKTIFKDIGFDEFLKEYNKFNILLQTFNISNETTLKDIGFDKFLETHTNYNKLLNEHNNKIILKDIGFDVFLKDYLTYKPLLTESDAKSKYNQLLLNLIKYDQLLKIEDEFNKCLNKPIVIEIPSLSRLEFRNFIIRELNNRFYKYLCNYFLIDLTVIDESKLTEIYNKCKELHNSSMSK